MPIGSSWWCHIRCGYRLDRNGCLRNSWWIWVKQWPKYFTHWPAGPVLCITFVQYLIAFCSRQEATSNVISSRFVGPVIPDNSVKFGDPLINLSPEIPPEAIWDGIFDGFFRCSFRLEVVTDVISCANVGQVGMAVLLKLLMPVKFGDTSSNGSRDIQQRSSQMQHFWPFF